jgi:hypothetical protein
MASPSPSIRTATENIVHIKIVLFKSHLKEPSWEWPWVEPDSCVCLSFLLQGRSLVFKERDSQSQETGQTSKLCGDAEAPVNRKQTFTVALSNSPSSKHLPLVLRGLG